MESNNIQLKNKIGGQERNETTKLVVQDVSTNLNITSKNHEESNTFNNIPLKSKNLTSAVDEIIEKNKKIGTNSLGNDYNDDLSFDEALKLAEAEAMRVLDEDKKKEEEMKDRNTIKKLKETASLSEVFLSNKKDVEKFSSQITTTKSTLVKGEANINDILLSSLPDIRRLKTTTVSPLTTSKNEIMKTTISLKISENIFGSSNNNRITNSNSIQMVPNDRKNNLELTTISIIDNNNNNKKSSIHRISLQISSTTTAIPIIKVSKCPTLNAYRDGKPHPNTSRYCKTLIPGVPDDNTCRCRYLVGSRDSNNCPSSFLYLCKPTAGK
uniref:RNAse_Pc domain-containing protein n=1 Tax=Parastrongyloides trichosuri TaxID=131310 RepID=A0A0N4Z618_PARTI